MARPSARNLMLEGALRAVETHGFAALTIDSAADAAGVTRRGLMYHFPTKDDLILGLHRFLAERTEAALRDALGGDPAEANHLDRTIAYVSIYKRAPTRADLQLILAARENPHWLAPWTDLRARWFPEERTDNLSEDPLGSQLLLARSTVDGLWSYQLIWGDECNMDWVIDRVLAQLADAREAQSVSD